MSLEAFTERYLPALEAEIRLIVQPAGPAADMVHMLHYHLGWLDESFRPATGHSGKRIRPLLCLLVCEACGGEWERALPAAAAIELVHNFSLIHDDIEDGDTTRRGRPTVWALWGPAQALNAGDALFAFAQLGMLRLAHRLSDAATVIAATELLNHTCLRLTEGQYLDISFERRQEVSIAEYLEMIERKTAALIACACELGARIAGSTKEPPDAARRYLRLSQFGHHLGLAFQIQDDILGIWGDPAVTGKPVGADLRRRKKTLPILHGIAQNSTVKEILAQGELTERDIQRAVESLEAAGSRAYAENLARQHHAQALRALEDAGLQGPAALALRELTQQLLWRER